MTLRLTVDTAAWRAQVDRVARRSPGLVPVVKGNGYGFGRPVLAEIAAELADTVAVGTVHELGGLPGRLTPVVLTPALQPPADTRPILTVGSIAHVKALDGWPGRVLVKLASSMQRYGTTPRGPRRARPRGARRAASTSSASACTLPSPAPTTSTPTTSPTGSRSSIPRTRCGSATCRSTATAALRDAWPDRRFRIRQGTALWHGDKAALHLGADVLDVRPARAGTIAGYRQVEMPVDGRLVMVGAGTAHGVHPLPDGRSPFHFDGRRLPLLEPPHMHTSMVVAAAGAPAPDVGDQVDVQRPLISTYVDEVRWR